MTETKRLKIWGRVQGVGFRYYVERQAQALHVNGWVRNCMDGSVEALVQGEASAVEAFLAAARRGPRRAEVERVEIFEAEGSYASFEIKSSA